MVDVVDHKSKYAIGFLTVVEHPQHGLFGGYLTLNASGRPLEFHCTAPLKPNRAQQILYGPTLQPFLYGEQIGLTLINQGSTPPALVCTDCEPALAARQYVSVPMVLVLPETKLCAADAASACLGATGSASAGLDETPAEPVSPEINETPAKLAMPKERLLAFQIGANRLAVPDDADEDRRLITERLADLSESFDLSEPFTRIRAAIEEAQKAVR
jgi:hypothetical protein